MECSCKLKEEQVTSDLHMQGHVQPLIVHVLDIVNKWYISVLDLQEYIILIQ